MELENQGLEFPIRWSFSRH